MSAPTAHTLKKWCPNGLILSFFFLYKQYIFKSHCSSHTNPLSPIPVNQTPNTFLLPTPFQAKINQKNYYRNKNHSTYLRDCPFSNSPMTSYLGSGAVKVSLTAGSTNSDLASPDSLASAESL